jgi:hypothetical protein
LLAVLTIVRHLAMRAAAIYSEAYLLSVGALEPVALRLYWLLQRGGLAVLA